MHPDTRELHGVHHNNHALRQHRNFTDADLRSAVNIGFFGDSMTENTLIPAPLSFTEPLDYLLNLRNPNNSFNVLNFGVNGYGLSESLLRYEQWNGGKLLHIFYVYTENDLYDDARRGVFYLDDTGLLSFGAMRYDKAPAVAKLHLSYLVMDAVGHLSPYVTEVVERAKLSDRARRLSSRMFYELPNLDGRSFALFKALLRRFKEAAERNGASFHLVWPASEPLHFLRLAAIARQVGVETYNLRACFGEHDPAHLHTPWRESPYRFKEDWHWNEAGNRLAAICLYRFTERLAFAAKLTDETIEVSLNRYYSAFDYSAADTWSPQQQSIRAKYEAFGEKSAGAKRCSSYTESGQLMRSTFDVYLEDGWIIYHSKGCKSADFDPPSFFLHAVPTDLRDLPPHRLVSGFDNLDFRWRGMGCTARRRLPNYAMELIRTGQFHLEGDGERLWEVAFNAQGG